jgi:hypothetical protein
MQTCNNTNAHTYRLVVQFLCCLVLRRWCVGIVYKVGTRHYVAHAIANQQRCDSLRHISIYAVAVCFLILLYVILDPIPIPSLTTP